MLAKYFVVASFEAADERQAQLVKEEVARIMRKRADEQTVSSPDVALRAVLDGVERPAETPGTCSMPMASMSLSCDDIFDIQPDTL